MEQNVTFMSQRIMNRMRQNGLANNTIKVYEHSVFMPIIKRYEELGKTSYDQDVNDELMTSYKSQFDAGVISKALYNWRKRRILLLQDFYSTGEFHQGIYCSKKATPVPDLYIGIMHEFTASLQTAESTKSRVTGIVRKFLISLDELGIKDIHSIEPEAIRRFMDGQHRKTPGSMDSMACAVSSEPASYPMVGLQLWRLNCSGTMASPLRGSIFPWTWPACANAYSR